MTPTISPTEIIDVAAKLREESSAVRLSHEKMGVTRSLTDSQLSTAASCFGADKTLMRAGKKLFDTSNPAYKKVTGVRTRATKFWMNLTVPYPEVGVRLIRRDKIETFEAGMNELRDELCVAVVDLDNNFQYLVDEAKARLGDLFDETEYPDTLIGLFSLDWDYPSFDPPEWLRTMSPKIYESQQKLVAARFQEAITLAEQTFIAELSKIVTHLVERLTGDVDGKPRIFRDSALGNLQDFFAKFGDLNIGSNADLTKLVDDCNQLAGNVTPDDLRGNNELRTHITEKLAEVGKLADSMMVEKPKRKISLEEDGGDA